MKIWDYISYFFTGYTDFTGRCPRPLFWRILPVWIAAFIGITFLSVEFQGAPRQVLFWGFLAITLTPLISLHIKRLHDFSASGFFVLGVFALSFLGGPWIGLIGMILIGCIPGSRGTNTYGDDARGGNASVFD